MFCGGIAKSLERLDDILDHLLRVRQQHHCVVAEEQLVLDASIAGPHRAFDEQNRPSIFDVEHRHAIDWRCLVRLRSWVGHVIRTDDESHFRVPEIGVDVFQLKHFVVGHLGFGEQNVHVAWHPSGNRVDRVGNFNAFFLKLVAHLFQSVLGLRHRHAVARNDDHFRSVLHDEGRVFSRSTLERTLFLAARSRRSIVAAKAAQDDRDEAPVHAFTHDVGQDRTGGTHKRTNHNQEVVAQGETNRRSCPAGIAV
mmetsp:Transcript_14374/g.18517  ORF Transcript_14374/g.18517 Transcript_14374/m.18517 type:complete len:253 (-) Transcript_14374:832-1590(-)